VSNRSIAREHLLGATLWAYAAGSVTINPWVQPEHYSLCRRAL
jgi:hypothetical protein